MKGYLLFLILLFIPLSIVAEQEEQEVVISEINWVLYQQEDRSSAGLTRETSLYRAFRIREEDRFRSTRHLERRLETGKLELESRYIYEYIDYNVVYLETEDYLEAIIYVYIKDRWTLFAFPKAAFDTNLGIIYGGKIQYKDLFGTLIDLNITGYYSKEQWDIMGELTNVDLFFLQANLFYTQHFENRYLYDNNENLRIHYSFQNSLIQLRTDFPILPGLTYYFMPGFLTTHSFDIIENPGGVDEDILIEEESFWAANLTHGFSFNQVTWEGTMRSGYFASLDNVIEVPLEKEIPQVDLDYSINGYTHFGDLIALSASLSGFRVFNGLRSNAGGKLRGVEDQLVYGKSGLYLNTSVEGRSLNLPPVLEIHLQPFVDAGYMISPGEEWREKDNWFISGGISAVVFPLMFKNLQLSAMLGYSLLEPGPYELTLQTGLFF